MHSAVLPAHSASGNHHVPNVVAISVKLSERKYLIDFLQSFLLYLLIYFIFDSLIVFKFNAFKPPSVVEWHGHLFFPKRCSVVVDLLFIVAPIVGVCNCNVFCCALLYVHSCSVIILMGKRNLIALLSLSSWCLVIVVVFLALSWVCPQFVIVVFPDYTHLLFYGGFVLGLSVEWVFVSSLV